MGAPILWSSAASLIRSTSSPTLPSKRRLPLRNSDGLLAWLQKKNGPLLFDGGVGTALVARGLKLEVEPPEAWLLSHPEVVRAVHAEFAAAGADVLQTNSFGLLRLMCGGWPASLPMPDWSALLRKSVELAQTGAEARPADNKGAASVVGSLGPSGLRELDEGRLSELSGKLAGWFRDAGVSALHLETFYHPQELRAVLRGVREAAPELPLLVSVTVSAGQNGLETPLGVPLARMLRELTTELPQMVGANCSQSARRMLPTVAALSEWAQGRVPILAQPQVDQSAPDCKRRSQPETPEKFAADLMKLLEEGADAIGGCCGCTPAHIAAAYAAISGSGVR